MKVAYFDCFSGASGDMILGALLDSGLSMEYLERELGKLRLSHYGLRRQRALRGGIKGTQLIVHVDSSHHGHAHRHLEQIVDIIEQSGLASEVKKRSIEIFMLLAKAEASVHDQPLDRVHFHEVGAVDAIIDVVGAAIGLYALGIERVYCSPVHVGAGTVECEHGILPVPAPATAELLKGVPFYSNGTEGELLTPTGAAILKSIAADFGSMPSMVMDTIGYGVGTRELTVPNLLRVLIGKSDDAQTTLATGQVVILETTIDDMNPQIYDYLAHRLRDLGAAEVFLTPVQMKKSRPGILLTLICNPGSARECAELVLRETTSRGMRWRMEQMTRVLTEIEEIQTEYGPIHCKIARMGENEFDVTPEYEDCKRIALNRAIPLRNIIDTARRDGLAALCAADPNVRIGGIGENLG